VPYWQVGTVEEEVGNGIFCVRLDGSARRLKVRENNVVLLDPRDPHARMRTESPAATTSGFSAAGARVGSGRTPAPCSSNARSSEPNQAQSNQPMSSSSQPRAAAPIRQPAVAQGFLRGLSENPRNAAWPPAPVQQQNEGSGAFSEMAGVPGIMPDFDPAADASECETLLRAFPRPALRANYGLFFELGCAKLIVVALRRRGGDLCGNVEHMREAVLKLTLQLEDEMIAAREMAECAAFPAAADAGDPAMAGAAPSVQVLAMIDEATREQRLTLWVLDVLKYAQPLATPVRHFYHPPGSQQHCMEHVFGVVVAIGHHSSVMAAAEAAARGAPGSTGVDQVFFC
jgi:hypothetical protein